MKLELDAPNIGKLEKRYLNDAIDRGFVSTFGPFVGEFEDKFASHLNVKKAVSTQSGTAALHIALHELGIGKGDEVLVPVLTFVATVNPVLYVGAKPVFVDVDPLTWNIDPQEVQRHITKKTKAIIPVHLYGNPCAMDEIVRIARAHRVAVVEDATESLGATYRGRATGTFGDFGCFSFNGNKIITTGGGGMVVGRNSKKIEHIKFLVNQARDASRGYYHPEIGFNYRMTNIEAALGLAQLERLGEFLKLKRDFHRIYRKHLSGLGQVRLQESYREAQSSCWLTGVTFSGDVKLPQLQKRLQGFGIPSRRVFSPLTQLPPYRSYAREKYPKADLIFQHSLCLPGSCLNSRKDIEFSARRLREVLAG